MSKSRTRKIAASALTEGMVIVIPAQRGVVKKCMDANEHIPSMSKSILYVEMDATHGPFKGATGRTLILDSDTIEIEVKPRWPKRAIAWALGL